MPKRKTKAKDNGNGKEKSSYYKPVPPEDNQQGRPEKYKEMFEKAISLAMNGTKPTKALVEAGYDYSYARSVGQNKLRKAIAKRMPDWIRQQFASDIGPLAVDYYRSGLEYQLERDVDSGKLVRPDELLKQPKLAQTGLQVLNVIKDESAPRQTIHIAQLKQIMVNKMDAPVSIPGSTPNDNDSAIDADYSEGTD